MQILERVVNELSYYIWSFGIPAGGETVPLVIIALLGTGLFMTLRLGLIQVRRLGHGFAVTSGKYDDPDFVEDGVKKKHTGYVTDLITDKALDWLKTGREKDKPFVLMCQHKAPHRNWQPGPAHLNTYDDVEMPYPDLRTVFGEAAAQARELLRSARSAYADGRARDALDQLGRLIALDLTQQLQL